MCLTFAQFAYSNLLCDLFLTKAMHWGTSQVRETNVSKSPGDFNSTSSTSFLRRHPLLTRKQFCYTRLPPPLLLDFKAHRANNSITHTCAGIELSSNIRRLYVSRSRIYIGQIKQGFN